jgi:alkanesulfonate monooxygenase SsuD/methylene tetrahydromethanopterin reductase-like flavin-dependent oxidoreductase (luciferase family)
MPRSPQGRPVIAQAGASAEGTDFAASVADIIYAVQTTFDEAHRFYRITKERIISKGRSPDDVKILPGMLPVIGSTEEEARRNYQKLLSYLDPILGLERLSRFFGDLTGHDLDGPLPDLRTDVNLVSRASLNLRLAREQNWSIRKLYEETIISHGHHVCIGTPQMIADEMQHWIEHGAADGFNIVPALLPQSLSDFADQVVPELQRRGLFRKEYESSTLRGHLELSEPRPRTP